MRGLIHNNFYEPQKALADFNAAIKIDSVFAAPYYNRGKYYQNKRDYKNAILDFKKYISLEKPSNRYYLKAKRRISKIERILKHNASKEKNSSDPSNKNKLAATSVSLTERCVALRRDRQFVKAIEACSQVLKAQPDADRVFIERGLAYRAAGKPDLARADFDKAIELNGKSGEVYYERAMTVFWTDHLLAIADMDKAVRLLADTDPLKSKASQKLLSWRNQRPEIKVNSDTLATAGPIAPNSVPIPRKRPIEVLMQAAAKMAIVPASPSVGRPSPSGSEPAAQPKPSIKNTTSLAAIGVPPFKTRPSNLENRLDYRPQATNQNKLIHDRIFAEQPVLSSQRKLALVIGNAAYKREAKLLNPRNDASDVSAMLRHLGFDVVEGLDLNKQEMIGKIRTFVERVKTADVVLVYYAGHGMQVRGKNYLLPVDARLETEKSLEFEAILAQDIYKHIADVSRISIVLLDACRNNPLARKYARSFAVTRNAATSNGLARPSTSSGGMLLGFATAPGHLALDTDGERNSPFTRALLKHFPTRGLEIQQVMTRVKADVAKQTKGRQRPWHESDLIKQVYLVD